MALQSPIRTQVPFNHTAKRVMKSTSPKLNPGPGAYQPKRSDFTKTLAQQSLITEQGSYMVNDNGHIN